MTSNSLYPGLEFLVPGVELILDCVEGRKRAVLLHDQGLESGDVGLLLHQPERAP